MVCLFNLLIFCKISEENLSSSVGILTYKSPFVERKGNLVFYSSSLLFARLCFLPNVQLTMFRNLSAGLYSVLVTLFHAQLSVAAVNPYYQKKMDGKDSKGRERGGGGNSYRLSVYTPVCLSISLFVCWFVCWSVRNSAFEMKICILLNGNFS